MYVLTQLERQTIFFNIYVLKENKNINSIQWMT